MSKDMRQKIKNQESKAPVMPAIKNLELWGQISFPIERANVVRVTAVNLGLSSKKQYTTHLKRDTREILVTRVQ